MTTLTQTIRQRLQPPLLTLKQYDRRKARADLLAGLSVAVVALPQSIAFALIAGVPVEYGIFTAIFQGILGAIFGASEHLSVGPTNTQSLLVASVLARYMEQPELYLQMVFALTLLKGLIQLLFAAAHMGNLVRYVSQSVIVGFTAGAGVLIAVGQLHYFLGIELPPGRSEWPGVIGMLSRLLPELGHANAYAVTVGAAALASMMAARFFGRYVPGALVAAVVGVLIVYFTGWGGEQVDTVGKLSGKWPAFQLPALDWTTAETLLAGAIAIALLGMLESVAIAKSIATHTGQRIDPDQEFFSQGLTNAVTSFIGCIPGSGSFSRSALNYTSGAATRFAGVWMGIFVAVLYLVTAPAAAMIPMAALAAILFFVAYGLIDFKRIFRIVRTSRSDAVVCIITFLAALFTPLKYAIYIGVFLNLALYLRQASRLHIAEMVRETGGTFRERPLRSDNHNQAVMFLQIEGDLFFGVADEFQDRLTDIAAGGVRVVIFRLKRTHAIDSTALAVLEQFVKLMHSRGGHVVLCGLKPELVRMLQASGVMTLIGRENVFETSMGVFTSAKLAIDRARELLDESVDASTIDDLDDDEAWAYEI